MANVGKQLDDAGADGLVLFNRFYQPDFDIEALEIVPSLTLSSRRNCFCGCIGWPFFMETCAPIWRSRAASIRAATSSKL